MGDDAVLAADSFLMKGEEIPAHAQWGGNPARVLTNHQISSVAQPVLVQPVLTQSVLAQPAAHPALPQVREEQRDISDERTELIPVLLDAFQEPSQKQWDISDERTELIPVLLDAFQELSQEQEGQRDHLDELADQFEEPTAKIPVYNPGPQRAAPQRTLCGGKTR